MEEKDTVQEETIETGAGEETVQEAAEKEPAEKETAAQAAPEEKEQTGRKKKKEKAPKKDPKEEKIAELNDRLIRNMAEFDNFRKRSEKEKGQRCV